MTRLDAIRLLALTSAVPAAAQKPEPKYEMTTYVLALLKKGPNWTAANTPEARKIQEGHMANIRKMAEAGKLAVAGPIRAAQELRGIFIFNVTSIEEAKALCDADPAIQTGHMVAELHLWMAAKGLTVAPPA